MGVLCVLALDHRDAMRSAFARIGEENVTADEMMAVKSRIAEALATRASAILLDPATVRSCRPVHHGLLVPLEQQGYEPWAGGRVSRLTTDFGPGDAAALGADGCKLLVHYRADHPATAARQLDLITGAVGDCHRHGLPIVVEPLVYRLEHEDEETYRHAYGDLVAAAARDVARSGADLLKLPFAGSLANCQRVTDAVAPLGWVLRGGKVDGKTFVTQLLAACRAGASGFMAGRPVWGDMLGLPREQQRRWLVREAAPLFDRLHAIAHRFGRSVP